MKSAIQMRKVLFLTLIVLMVGAVGLFLLDVLMNGKVVRLLYRGQRTGKPSVLPIFSNASRA